CVHRRSATAGCARATFVPALHNRVVLQQAGGAKTQVAPEPSSQGATTSYSAGLVHDAVLFPDRAVRCSNRSARLGCGSHPAARPVRWHSASVRLAPDRSLDPAFRESTARCRTSSSTAHKQILFCSTAPPKLQ